MIRKSFLAVILYFLMTLLTFAGSLTVEGIYQGKNLYVQNPFTSSGVGFCTTDVFVNNIRSTDEVQSSAFEIDLTLYRLKLGDKVNVVVKFKEDCSPKILNPEVLKPSSTFELVSAKADESAQLKWTTKNEGSPMPFIVEQFRWNKWIKVGEVQGKGIPTENNYSTKVNYHSGLNKFRIQQTDHKGPRYVGKEITFKSSIPEVTFYPVKATKDINFSAETMYEVYDQLGKLITKGVGNKVSVEELEKGPYYLNYDNKSESFFKK